jgi:hypothetical protein
VKEKQKGERGKKRDRMQKKKRKIWRKGMERMGSGR